ncbi:MAG: carbonic anhydrase [Bradyrhizobiaceae bacterium]|nr:carbonic anhydrase [Bradyrhizobiaceae bacterium]
MFPERLTAGYQAFLGGRFADERSRYQSLASSGQRPETLVIGCVDSRVSPEVIFNAAPGELLVVRNVAALVPAYDAEHRTTSQHGTSAALEFGVTTLGVSHIVVLGHALCGGIRAFAEKQKPLSSSDFIGHWMSQIAPAAERLGPASTQDAYLRRLEFASVELSLNNLMTFPCVKLAVGQGRLTLHGAYFGIATGHLLVRDSATGRFEPAFDGLPVSGKGGA